MPSNQLTKTQLAKGLGDGDMDWPADFVLTSTDSVTPLFKVSLANGNTTVAGTLTATGGIVGGASPSGAAGGDLSGTYPNPTVSQSTAPSPFRIGRVYPAYATTAAVAITKDFAADGFQGSIGLLTSNEKSTLTFQRANGPAATPSGVLSGDVIARFTSAGYGATGLAGFNQFLNVIATENYNDTSSGTKTTFRTIPNGSSAAQDRMTIDQNGNTAVGSQAPAYKLDVAGDVASTTAGNGLRVKEGANAKMGTAVLSAGSAVVANTAVTANSRIMLTSQADGGAPGFLRVSTRTAGTSFTITSSSGTDTSTVAYLILEPS